MAGNEPRYADDRDQPSIHGRRQGPFTEKSDSSLQGRKLADYTSPSNKRYMTGLCVCVFGTLNHTLSSEISMLFTVLGNTYFCGTVWMRIIRLLHFLKSANIAL